MGAQTVPRVARPFAVLREAGLCPRKCTRWASSLASATARQAWMRAFELAGKSTSMRLRSSARAFELGAAMHVLIEFPAPAEQTTSAVQGVPERQLVACGSPDGGAQRVGHAEALRAGHDTQDAPIVRAHAEKFDQGRKAARCVANLQGWVDAAEQLVQAALMERHAFAAPLAS